MTAVSPGLADFFRGPVGLHDAAVRKNCYLLQKEDVFELADLVELRTLKSLESCGISALSARRIDTALASIASEQSNPSASPIHNKSDECSPLGTLPSQTTAAPTEEAPHGSLSGEGEGPAPTGGPGFVAGGPTRPHEEGPWANADESREWTRMHETCEAVFGYTVDGEPRWRVERAGDELFVFDVWDNDLLGYFDGTSGDDLYDYVVGIRAQLDFPYLEFLCESGLGYYDFDPSLAALTLDELLEADGPLSDCECSEWPESLPYFSEALAFERSYYGDPDDFDVQVPPSSDLESTPSSGEATTKSPQQVPSDPESTARRLSRERKGPPPTSLLPDSNDDDTLGNPPVQHKPPDDLANTTTECPASGPAPMSDSSSAASSTTDSQTKLSPSAARRARRHRQKARLEYDIAKDLENPDLAFHPYDDQMDEPEFY